MDQCFLSWFTRAFSSLGVATSLFPFNASFSEFVCSSSLWRISRNTYNLLAMSFGKAVRLFSYWLFALYFFIYFVFEIEDKVRSSWIFKLYSNSEKDCCWLNCLLCFSNKWKSARVWDVYICRGFLKMLFYRDKWNNHFWQLYGFWFHGISIQMNKKKKTICPPPTKMLLSTKVKTTFISNKNP